MITNFFVYFLKAPVEFFKKLLNTPIITMFYALLSKWYIIFMTLCVIVLYWVIMGLNKSGVIEYSFRTLVRAGNEIKGFAQHCTPLITDINKFIKCTIDTPTYSGDEVTNSFENAISIDTEKFDILFKDTVKNPSKAPSAHDKIYFVSPYDVIHKAEKTLKNSTKIDHNDTNTSSNEPK
jgi:hypothetical protein